MTAAPPTEPITAAIREIDTASFVSLNVQQAIQPIANQIILNQPYQESFITSLKKTILLHPECFSDKSSTSGAFCKSFNP